MKKDYCVAALALGAALAIAPAALADGFNFSFNGNGITSSGTIWVGAQSSNATTPPGYEITGITGTFSDSNVPGGVSGAITGLYTPVSYISNTLGNPGVAFTSGGLSYDDLFYPAGDSPQVCWTLINGVPTLTYPFSGGVFDIFGVAFNVAGGYTGAFWSNGDLGSGLIYAAGLADASGLLDNPNAGPDSQVPPGEFGSFTTSPVPEPASMFLLGFGLLGLALVVARKRISANR
ncbi:MAG TPA: PEP-CTERM sorting domain-containing protein [Bryobacteraceae bacterium]